MGNVLVYLLPRRKMEKVRPAMLWALGRIGGREPLYGPLNTVVPLETAEAWLARVLDTVGGEAAAWLAVMQLARRTDDRYRDISAKLRGRAIRWLENEAAPAHFLELIRTAGRLDADEQGMVFGESLPKGLRLG